MCFHYCSIKYLGTLCSPKKISHVFSTAVGNIVVASLKWLNTVNYGM
jgi:hypothetical protein